MISHEDFPNFMFKLGEPLGWVKQFKYDASLQTYFLTKIAEKMPDHKKDPEGKWYMNEVLD